MLAPMKADTLHIGKAQLMMHSTQPRTAREMPVSSSARVAIVHPDRGPRFGLRVPLFVLLVPLYWISFLPFPPFQQISEGLILIFAWSWYLLLFALHQVSLLLLELSLRLLLDREVRFFKVFFLHKLSPSCTCLLRYRFPCSPAASTKTMTLICVLFYYQAVRPS